MKPFDFFKKFDGFFSNHVGENGLNENVGGARQASEDGGRRNLTNFEYFADPIWDSSQIMKQPSKKVSINANGQLSAKAKEGNVARGYCIKHKFKFASKNDAAIVCVETKESIKLLDGRWKIENLEDEDEGLKEWPRNKKKHHIKGS